MVSDIDGGDGGVIINVGTEDVSVEALIPHPRNANVGDLASIKESIHANGFFGRLVVNQRTKHVLVGNHRLQAAVELGYTHVPVEWVDVSDEDELRILLVDNRTARLGDDDEKALSALLLELQDTDSGLAGTGYDEGFLEDLLEALRDKPTAGLGGDDFDPSPERGETETQEGDLWLIDGGRHRLYIGDSTEPGTALAAMPAGEMADLLWTDPPYNVAYVGKTKDALTIQNDSMQDEEFRAFLVAAFTAADAVLKPGGVFYIAHADSEGYNFRGAVRDVGWKLAQCIIWAKDVFVMGRQDYHWKHEPILYGWREGAGHHKLEDRTQSTVWEIARPKRSEDHPTMKPIELVEKAIANSTDPGEWVLDLFGGSGTTLIAAHRQGRRSCLVELDPAYGDVILRRAREEGLQTEKASL